MSTNDNNDAVREFHDRQDRIIVEGCKMLAPVIGGPLGLALYGLGVLCEASTHLDKLKETEKRQQS